MARDTKLTKTPAVHLVHFWYLQYMYGSIHVIGKKDIIIALSFTRRLQFLIFKNLFWAQEST